MVALNSTHDSTHITLRNTNRTTLIEPTQLVRPWTPIQGERNQINQSVNNERKLKVNEIQAQRVNKKIPVSSSRSTLRTLLSAVVKDRRDEYEMTWAFCAPKYIDSNGILGNSRVIISIFPRYLFINPQNTIKFYFLGKQNTDRLTLIAPTRHYRGKENKNGGHDDRNSKEITVTPITKGRSSKKELAI